MIRKLKDNNISYASFDISLESQECDKNLTTGNITSVSFVKGDVGQSLGWGRCKPK